MKGAVAEARRWYREAASDLEVVRTLKGAGYYAAACFYAQQAAEKAVKAVHFSQGRRVVLGHSIRELLRRCLEFEPRFEEMMAQGSLLDQFYIPTRYPNGLPWPATPSETYTAKQAGEAEAAAAEILAAVEDFLRRTTQVLTPEG